MGLDELMKQGLSAAPQKGIKVSSELANYMEQYFVDEAIPIEVNPEQSFLTKDNIEEESVTEDNVEEIFDNPDINEIIDDNFDATISEEHFNKYKADSTFASFGDDSIICNNNLGQPAFTILLHSKILFSAKIIKL